MARQHPEFLCKTHVYQYKVWWTDCAPLLLCTLRVQTSHPQRWNSPDFQIPKPERVIIKMLFFLLPLLVFDVNTLWCCYVIGSFARVSKKLTDKRRTQTYVRIPVRSAAFTCFIWTVLRALCRTFPHVIPRRGSACQCDCLTRDLVFYFVTPVCGSCVSL